MPIETTELERRVLAHERILQALIRHSVSICPCEVRSSFVARLPYICAVGTLSANNC